jgi:hypothetical protein
MYSSSNIFFACSYMHGYMPSVSTLLVPGNCWEYKKSAEADTDCQAALTGGYQRIHLGLHNIIPQRAQGKAGSRPTPSATGCKRILY